MGCTQIQTPRIQNPPLNQGKSSSLEKGNKDNSAYPDGPLKLIEQNSRDQLNLKQLKPRRASAMNQCRKPSVFCIQNTQNTTPEVDLTNRINKSESEAKIENRSRKNSHVEIEDLEGQQNSIKRENGGMESRGKKFRNSNFGNEKHINDGKQKTILKL